MALLRYRPPTVMCLLDALLATKKEQVKTAYIGDALWRIMKALYKEIDVPSYSEFELLLDGKKRKEERSGKEIINDIKFELKKRMGGVENSDEPV